MSASQADLFGKPSRTGEAPGEEIVALVRSRLRAKLALVKSAEAMPWTDHLASIREDNAFRFGKDVLPPAEGAALWAEFNAEMDRLYAIMNEGKEPDRGD
jgi:hypothetical protein